MTKATIFLSFFLSSQLALAEFVDLKSYQTAVKDQKNTDTCAFFAISGLVESVVKTSLNLDVDISEGFEWQRSKVLKKQRPEVEFGNTEQVARNIVDDGYVILEDQKRLALHFLKTEVLTKLWVNRPWSEQFMGQLKKKRSVVVTVKVAIPLINDAAGTFTYSPEIDQQCQKNQIPCGGHAILITGFDSDKKIFFFKNSWGEKWGQQGYGTISFEHIDNYSDQPVVLYFDQILGPWARFE